jgi:hypothetical protein
MRFAETLIYRMVTQAVGACNTKFCFADLDTGHIRYFKKLPA